MNCLVSLCIAVGAGFMMTSLTLATEPLPVSPAQGNNHQPGYLRGTIAAYFADNEANKEAEKSIGEKAVVPEYGSKSKSCGDEAPACGDEAGGCGNDVESGTCFCENWGTLCCLDNSWPFTCCSDLGDPCTLQKRLTPCCETTYGGWVAFGYYSNNDPLSVSDNDLLSFWDRPNELNLDQTWLYVEKLAKSDGCNWACGYRFDLVYGVDAQKTQAFGNSGAPNAQGYDNGWDNGTYGWALPQSYLQFAKGDWEVKVGHFFTPVGYEVIPATGNFFYSHSLTMFNSEPFTHTGALSTYKASDTVTYYVGWTLGWDTGYDQFGSGNSFLGGVSLRLSDSVKYTYICTAGDLGWRGDSGYSHSNVLDFTLSSKWQYVFQSDILTADPNASNTTGDALSYGVNSFLFYTINDCWKWGTRAEWWKSNTTQVAEMVSFQEVATGLNYKVNANLIVRPEVKWNWTGSQEAFSNATGGADFNCTLFGMDAIYTF